MPMPVVTGTQEPTENAIRSFQSVCLRRLPLRLLPTVKHKPIQSTVSRSVPLYSEPKAHSEQGATEIIVLDSMTGRNETQQQMKAFGIGLQDIPNGGINNQIQVDSIEQMVYLQQLDIACESRETEYARKVQRIVGEYGISSLVLNNISLLK